MTWSAALPGAALRAMRTAAGRRALEVALLVGAVFVLGMLCGERAQAADGVQAETSSLSLSDSPFTGTTGTVGAVVSAPVNGVRAERPGGEARRAAGQVPPADTRRPGRPEAAEAPASEPGTSATGPTAAGTVQAPWAADPFRPLTESLVRTVDERIVRPVGEAVGTVTGRSVVSPEELPTLPELPGPTRPLPRPDLPGLPAVPGPAVPGPAVPGPVVPGHTLPAPITSDPGAGSPAPRPEDPTASTPTAAGASVPDGRTGAVAPVALGPVAVDAHGATRGADGHGAPRDAVHAEPAPAPHAPAGQPDGTAGSRSTADNGTPRHGDAHAVTPCPRPPLRLVPGATERAEATGTRDRYRDVPVSPA
ncbi:hypothetical protein [Streptomyces sp. Tu 3180]|uniref:hypothetical protein n=1 Tax=Streptomyces sp. Tu 3180 TaxID=2682611 RepID=UPI0013569890|nr:hypothetical protein [Streptomyces sp. Tu 3180]KAF3463152.1 hypothetical protein GL259_24105 [Streptomyces sp. Tu 3180]